jgi:hypothetical protein
MINKGRAALVAVLFFGLVKPETTPEMWIVSFLSILMYEAVLMGMNIWTATRQEKTRKNEELKTYYHNKANGRRWKNTTMMWQMREVNK